MIGPKETVVPDIERLTVALPAELAASMKSAVEAGDYASTSDVVRSALRDWTITRSLRIEEFVGLKADIEAGIADIDAGRIRSFDTTRIVELGEKRSTGRSPFA